MKHQHQLSGFLTSTKKVFKDTDCDKDIDSNKLPGRLDVDLNSSFTTWMTLKIQ